MLQGEHFGTKGGNWTFAALSTKVCIADEAPFSIWMVVEVTTPLPTALCSIRGTLASLLTVFQEPVIGHFSTATATPVSATLAEGGNDIDASCY
jgi:hypothetical protein